MVDAPTLLERISWLQQAGKRLRVLRAQMLTANNAEVFAQVEELGMLTHVVLENAAALEAYVDAANLNEDEAPAASEGGPHA